MARSTIGITGSTYAGLDVSLEETAVSVVDEAGKIVFERMVPTDLHGGTPRGAEKIAACWADARKVLQVVFKPDWTRNQKAAPFRRNDQLLEAIPIGVVVFPGSGVTDAFRMGDHMTTPLVAKRHARCRGPVSRGTPPGGPATARGVWCARLRRSRPCPPPSPSVSAASATTT